MFNFMKYKHSIPSTLSLDIIIPPSPPPPCHPTESGINQLYQQPGFWIGVRKVRQADLSLAESEGLPSHTLPWLNEAVQRATDLLNLTRETPENVTKSPEFIRWHSPSGPHFHTLESGSANVR